MTPSPRPRPTQELAAWEPRSADGRAPVKVHYAFGDHRCAVAAFPVDGALFDVEVFARTDWNRPGIYTTGERIGVIRRAVDGWHADLSGVGPITSPWIQGGLEFPSLGNAMVNLMNRARPRLPGTMLPRSGLRLLYPMRGACPRCRCRTCTARLNRS